MTKLKSRLIIGLAVLTLTTSVFADTKTDYDQAIQYVDCQHFLGQFL